MWESRLPVGSSANTSSGREPRARAIATRCCWPPESSHGRCLSLGTSSERHQQIVDPLLLGGRGLAPVQLEGQFDVAEHIQGRNEVERLEHEPDLAAAQQRELGVAKPGDLLVAEPDPARGGRVEARHDVHQGRLARAARAHDRGEVAAAQAHGDVVEGGDRGRPAAVGLREVLDACNEAEVGGVICILRR